MARPVRRVLAIEPYLAGSHRLFLDGLSRWSRHEWAIASLPPRKWKWRLRTSALHFAEVVAKDGPWDLLFVSDFLNLAELIALLPSPARDIPAIVYFHENQLTYPMQDGERRDVHFALNHLYAMLASEAVAFNSCYHRDQFARELQKLLAMVPDVATRPWYASAMSKVSVLPIGHDLDAVRLRSPVQVPIILWNHRWEYDKNPAGFLEALVELDARGTEFRVRLLGQKFETVPVEFSEIIARMGPRLDRIGYVSDREEYLEQVRGADIVVSTAHHEFFGLGTLEALRLGLYPVLPNDLAYPELLPDDDAIRKLFLYDRSLGLADPLARALEGVRRGEHLESRAAILRHTDRFHWSSLAPHYDDLIDSSTSGEDPGAQRRRSPG